MNKAAVVFIFPEKNPDEFQEIVTKAKTLFDEQEDVKAYAAIRDAADQIQAIFDKQPSQSEEDSLFEFYRSEGEELSIEGAIGQAIGAASMCWSETPRGIFESGRARNIAEKLKAFILDKTQ